MALVARRYDRRWGQLGPERRGEADKQRSFDGAARRFAECNMVSWHLARHRSSSRRKVDLGYAMLIHPQDSRELQGLKCVLRLISDLRHGGLNATYADLTFVPRSYLTKWHQDTLEKRRSKSRVSHLRLHPEYAGVKYTPCYDDHWPAIESRSGLCTSLEVSLQIPILHPVGHVRCREQWLSSVREYQTEHTTYANLKNGRVTQCYKFPVADSERLRSKLVQVLTDVARICRCKSVKVPVGWSCAVLAGMQVAEPIRAHPGLFLPVMLSNQDGPAKASSCLFNATGTFC